MRPLYFFGIIFLLFCSLHAQNNSNIHELLKETESVLYTQPAEAIKISQYILSKAEKASDLAAANLILAEAFYVMGQFNEAAKYSLEAKELSKNIENVELQIKTQIFSIKLLRELGFAYLADKYISEINTRSNHLDENLSMWLEAQLKQDLAMQDLIVGNVSSAKPRLYQALKTFETIQDTISFNNVLLTFSDLYLATEKIDSANYYSHQVLKNIKFGEPNSFHEMSALNQIAHVHFLKKEFLKSQSFFEEAYYLSEKLPNIYYKNQSLQGLMTSFLALENKEEYSKAKVLQTLSSTEVDLDRALAMNSVYNFINKSEKNNAAVLINSEYTRIYILGSLLFVFLGFGLLFYYYLNIKTAQYNAIWKYIKPSEPKIEIKESSKTLEKSSIVPEEIEIQILEKLKKFEKGTKFTQSEMSIALMASKFDTNTKYLSEVINRQKGKNFNAYINELRINYIIEKLRTNKVYSQYKISYLAEESGFSSHSSFATVFKSITGLSPTAFIDLLKKQTT